VTLEIFAGSVANIQQLDVEPIISAVGRRRQLDGQISKSCLAPFAKIFLFIRNPNQAI
jgi:hypothetical protein